MLARLSPVLLVLGLAGGEAEEATALLRVTSGEARLAEGRTVLTLDARAGEHALAGAEAWVETSAASAIGLVWRGQAGMKLAGPAAFQLERGPALDLERFRTAEIEVRRGKLALEIAGVGWLELGAGALELASLPDGVVELRN